MKDKQKAILKLVKEVLSGQLGLEPSDINITDSFVEDLHMRPDDLTDFLEKLEAAEIDSSTINLKEIKTVEDLVNYIHSEEEF